jgi:hypothetical protein
MSLLLFGSVLLSSGAAFGNRLPLPGDARKIKDGIAQYCRDCLKKGLIPTGTNRIGFGKHFFSNFFTGYPKRGILISGVIIGAEFQKHLRTRPYNMLTDMLIARFSRLKLFIIEQDTLKVHYVKAPENVRVVVSKELHECLFRTNRPLCCCCTQGCETECCEKKLGSAYVSTRWTDPLNPEWTLEYQYFPHAGASRLYEVDHAGKRKHVRWCLDASGPGYLDLDNGKTRE